MSNVRQDANSWTHIDWTLNGVTPDMIDWHWSNMEKTFILWHPQDHRGFRWYIPPTKDKFLGCVHLTLQGPRRPGESLDKIDFGLVYYDVAKLPKAMADVIIYDHVCLVGGAKLNQLEGPVESYRIHQWQASDNGVIGMSSAISPNPKDINQEKERLMNWTKHAIGEVGNWEVFLSDIYRRWQAVKDPDINIFHSLKVKKTATGAKYVNVSTMEI